MASPNTEHQGTTLLAPKMLQSLMGYTATSAGQALSLGGLATLLCIPLVGFLISKVDARYAQTSLGRADVAAGQPARLHRCHPGVCDRFAFCGAARILMKKVKPGAAAMH